MGLRKRGPYAPVRTPIPTIDFAAAEREAAEARRQVARVEQDARAGMQEAMLDADPIAQLIKRCAAIEERLGAIESRQAELLEMIQTVGQLARGEMV